MFSIHHKDPVESKQDVKPEFRLLLGLEIPKDRYM